MNSGPISTACLYLSGDKPGEMEKTVKTIRPSFRTAPRQALRAARFCLGQQRRSLWLTASKLPSENGNIAAWATAIQQAPAAQSLAALSAAIRKPEVGRSTRAMSQPLILAK